MKQGYTAGFNFGNKQSARKSPKCDQNQPLRNQVWVEAEEDRCEGMWWKQMSNRYESMKGANHETLPNRPLHL